MGIVWLRKYARILNVWEPQKRCKLQWMEQDPGCGVFELNSRLYCFAQIHFLDFWLDSSYCERGMFIFPVRHIFKGSLSQKETGELYDCWNKCKNVILWSFIVTTMRLLNQYFVAQMPKLLMDWGLSFCRVLINIPHCPKKQHGPFGVKLRPLRPRWLWEAASPSLMSSPHNGASARSDYP